MILKFYLNVMFVINIPSPVVSYFIQLHIYCHMHSLMQIKLFCIYLKDRWLSYDCL